MRPLLLNTFDRDGGAARAAMRLHLALLGEGVPSQMLVQWKSSNLSSVIAPAGLIAKAFSRLKAVLEGRALRNYTPISKDFSAPWTPTLTPRRVRTVAPDLVHLHWTSYGFLNIPDLRRLGAPILWTLHDMWAFTGGCHYSLGCSRYQDNCGSCHILGSTRDNDLSRSVWARKQAFWRSLPMEIITPSRWLADCALKSSLFAGRHVHVIPNAVDVQMFKPNDRAAIRTLLGLPQEPKLVLFAAVDSANNPRKGPDRLRPALEKLRQRSTRSIELIVIGQDRPSPEGPFALPTHYMGSISDEAAVAAIYAAADVVVLPSVEDNLPNIAMEALACGRPCVAFDIGGMPDLISHRVSGYLARDNDTTDLADGILFCLEESHAIALANAAREHVLEHYTPQIVARQHIALYEQVLARRAQAG
jgi:glycosyltransferase involved in cell wall biosynthesis